MKRALVVACLLAFALLPAVAAAASYEIVSYTWTGAVQTDGSARVAEDIAYLFRGDFNGPLFTLRAEGREITALEIVDEAGAPFTRVETLGGVPGTYTAVWEGDALEIKVYDPGDTEARAYGIRYRVEGFARRYRDAARIYYTPLRAESDYQRVTLTVALPGTEDAAIHVLPAERAGTFTQALSEGVLTLEANGLSEGGGAVVDLLFPAEWLPDAQTEPQDIWPVIREDEAARVRAAENRARFTQALRTAATLALGAYAIGFLCLFLANQKRYRLRRRILPRADDALLAALPPAVAERVAKGELSSAALSATLVALAEAGNLTMETRAEGVVGFAAVPGAVPPPHPHQQALLNWLFAGGDTLWTNALNAGDDYPAAQAFNTAYNRWKASVAADAIALGYLFDGAGRRAALCACAAVAGLFLASVLFGTGAVALGVLGCALAAAFTALFACLRRLTDRGEAALAALRSFTDTDWERFAAGFDARGRLPLAMALGFAERAAAWAERIADAAENPGADGASDVRDLPWFLYAAHLPGMQRTIHAAQNHNAFVNDPKASGGTSGGGVPGGGGSSHGAW